MGLDSALTVKSAAPWDREAGWLVPGLDFELAGANCTWLQYLIVRRSAIDDGTLESPWASNRGPRIDKWTLRAGLQPPVWWCGVWAGAVLRDCGVLVPVDYPATNAFVPHLVPDPVPGAAIVYGANGVSHHIGLVTRLALGIPGRERRHDVMTREGNRGAAGTNSNNGVAVDQGPLSRTDVMGFFPPRPVPNWALPDYASPAFLLEHFAVLPNVWKAASAAKIEAALRAA